MEDFSLTDDSEKDNRTLREIINKLEKKVAALELDQKNKDAEIANLNKTIEGHQKEIASLKGRITALELKDPSKKFINLGKNAVTQAITICNQHQNKELPSNHPNPPPDSPNATPR